MKGINLGEPYTMFEERRLKVELDKKALYALASDTRMEILKALLTDRRTVSQLAELLQADKAGVHRHLKKLEEGGFVSRVEDHNFVYYALTWKARDLISPGENTKIVILMSSAFLVLLVVGLILMSSSAIDPLGADDDTKTDQAENGAFMPDSTGDGRNVELVAAGILAISAVPLLYVTCRKLRRPKQPDAQHAEGLVIGGNRDTSD
ncbi:MAG: winged helix-turn-helix domain-containing protein [Euryarchaeota archaeon]|nr:winged helix-turn-helix domain-containing protein [Euryarchaeota archaeon]